MDGIHDMGGMAGFGPIPIEVDEPVFHDAWEGRVLALNLTLTTFLPGNIDYGRSIIEQIPPADYLAMTYYERWFDRILVRCQMNGVIDKSGLEAVHTGTPPAVGVTAQNPPAPPDLVLAFVQAGNPAHRTVDVPAAFKVGDRVHTRNLRREGHTRLPRYARDKTGIVVAHHGAHVLPDSNAKMEGENPTHLYSIRFDAQTLWGPDAHPKDTVTLDLWESYLDPA